MKEFIYQQLANKLRSNIVNNIWQENERLPSIRTLSQQNQVSKITVQTALHKLEASGLIFAKPKSGYYVAPKQKLIQETKEKHTPINAPNLVKVPSIFHNIMAHGAAFDIFPNTQQSRQDHHLQLLNRHINRAMRQNVYQHSSYYDNPAGNKNLQKQLSEHYQSRNLFINSDDICITSGCQHSLFLALSTCCQPGDTVAIESPAFYGCLQLLQLLKLQVVEIPTSSQFGVSANSIADIVKRWHIKACIVTPSFSTPTGAVMPKEEKIQLLSLAEKHHFTLIEDDIYGDLNFHFSTEPIKAFDTSGCVILCSSFSKALSRDLRMGWIMGGQYHNDIVHLKLVNSLASNQAIQQGLANFIAEGDYRRHLVQYRQKLLQQRNDLINTIDQLWSFPFSYTVPNGGLSLWVVLPNTVNTTDIYQKALNDGIIITPGMLFSASEKFLHCMRLSFVHEINQARSHALKLIGQLIMQQLAEQEN